MEIYIPLIQNFAGRIVMFHESVAQCLHLHATDVKALRLLGGKSLTASLLAEEIGLTGAAVTALVDRLEAGGYVRRERDTDDRRRVTIHAVPEKVRELDYLYDGISVAMSGLLSKYKKAEFATITDYFTNAITILTEQTKALRHNDLETSQDKKGRKRKAPVAAD